MLHTKNKNILVFIVIFSSSHFSAASCSFLGIRWLIELHRAPRGVGESSESMGSLELFCKSVKLKFNQGTSAQLFFF